MEIDGITPKAAGLMIGIITFIGFEAGFFTPVIIGWIEKMTGSLKNGLLLVQFISFLMAILPVFLKETGPRPKRPQDREKTGDVHSWLFLRIQEEEKQWVVVTVRFPLDIG